MDCPECPLEKDSFDKGEVIVYPVKKKKKKWRSRPSKRLLQE